MLDQPFKTPHFRPYQEQQRAKPGKQISLATILLRDLWWDVCSSETDAYFISIDFRKAFDSIYQRWLFRVLQNIFYKLHTNHKLLKQQCKCKSFS